MYSLPSTSQMRAPLARLTKNGWPPTARNARTGELTPPGIYFSASANNLSDWVRFMGLNLPPRSQGAKQNENGLTTKHTKHTKVRFIGRTGPRIPNLPFRVFRTT